jgi:hypothetical protein
MKKLGRIRGHKYSRGDLPLALQISEPLRYLFRTSLLLLQERIRYEASITGAERGAYRKSRFEIAECRFAYVRRKS